MHLAPSLWPKNVEFTQPLFTLIQYCSIVTYPAEKFAIVQFAGLLKDEHADGVRIDGPHIRLHEPGGHGGVDQVPSVLVPDEFWVDGAGHAAAEVKLAAEHDGSSRFHHKVLRGKENARRT